MWEYWMMRETQLRLNKHNENEDNIVVKSNLKSCWKIDNVQGFCAKKFETKKVRNKRNNKVGKDTEYRTIIMMRG